MGLRDAMLKKYRDRREKARKEGRFITAKTRYYEQYQLPFDLRMTWDYTLTRQRGVLEPQQTINLSGSVEPTRKWRLNYTLNYDLALGEISYTNFSFRRNLHCWEFQFDWTPTGYRKGFYFTIRARASELESLKLEKNSFFFDN